MKNVSPAFAALAVTALLTACGGGGSATAPGATPPAAIFSFTCWNGVVLSSTVQPTKVGCAAVTDSAIKAAVTGSALAFTGIPSGAALTGSTLVAQNGNSSITFTNGTITSGTMLLSTTYTFTGGKLTFSNAPDLTIAGSFTTGADPAPCVLPAMKNSFGVCINPPAAAGYTWNTVLGGGVWEANEEIFTSGTLSRVGTLVSGANQMSTGCQNIGDDVWLKDSASGKIKYLRSGLLTPDGQQLSFAYHQSCSSLPGFQAGVYVLKPMYSNKVAESPSTSLNVSNGGLTTPIIEAKGTDAGVKAKTPSGSGTGFWVMYYDAVQKAFFYKAITGPL